MSVLSKKNIRVDSVFTVTYSVFPSSILRLSTIFDDTLTKWVIFNMEYSLLPYLNHKCFMALTYPYSGIKKTRAGSFVCKK